MRKGQSKREIESIVYSAILWYFDNTLYFSPFKEPETLSTEVKNNHHTTEEEGSFCVFLK